MPTLEEITSLAMSLRPRGSYPRTTKFGQRVYENELAKKIVASYIALEYVQDGMDLFIADGSSAFWVGIALMEQDLDVRIYTNNAAIGMESIIWEGCQAEVFGAEGRYDGNYAGIYGSSALRFAKRMSHSTQMSILPVTGLNHGRGPCAGNADARRIKQAVLINGQHVVMVTDSNKIVPAEQSSTAWAFPGIAQQEWERLRDSGKLAVICDLPTSVESAFMSTGALRSADGSPTSVVKLSEIGSRPDATRIPEDPAIRAFVQLIDPFISSRRCEARLVRTLPENAGISA